MGEAVDYPPCACFEEKAGGLALMQPIQIKRADLNEPILAV